MGPYYLRVYPDIVRDNPPRCNPRTNSAARTIVEIRSIDEVQASLLDKLPSKNRIWLISFPGYRI
jgi:hypothetical protein